MKIKQPGPFINGANKIVDINGPYREYLMDFEMLKMTKGDIYTNSDNLERVYLLVYGAVNLQYDEVNVSVSRENFYDYDPTLLQLCAKTTVTIECLNEDT